MRLPWDELEEDAAGRLSPERSARIVAQGGGDQEGPEWTVDKVRDRLLEAAHGCERLGGRIGPARMKGFWPDIDAFRNMTPSDEMERALAVIGGTRPRERSARPSLDPREVALIEEAIEWPGRYLGADEHTQPRKALQIWLWCDVRRQKFEATARAMRMSPRTARWRRDAALRVILEGVTRDGVRP